MQIHNNMAEPWKVTIVDTGLSTLTGGRIKRVKDYIGNETFMLTYGDGVCDVDLQKLYKYHKEKKKTATITAVQPGSRFGSMKIEKDNIIEEFAEKSKSDGGWINGGFMVLEPEVIDYIEGDAVTFEKEPLERLAEEKKLIAYKFNGFWQCMDTMRDKNYLESLLLENKAPWKIWND